ncbi:MAG: PmoA family protein [Sedimentisphaerales bacterium]|nr:PmoA family protein [Sedimentisphaerales bacterium]
MCARLAALAIGISLVILCGTGFCAEPLATITVEAGTHAATDAPMSVPLATVPQAVAGQALSLQEVRGSDRVTVPAQIEQGATPRLHWILSGTLPAGQTRAYELVAGSAPAQRVVSATKDEKVLEISVGDAKVMEYHHAASPAPKGVGRVPESKLPLYDHSAFIHPLWSPKGTVLTDINPPDHLHHMGIWMPWTHTTFEGKMVDFWNVGDGTGTVRFSRYVSTTTGPVYGGFQSEQDHIALQTSKGEQTILKEIWDVRVYNMGGREKGYWLVDFQSTQRCVADQPLIQEEYHYSGFGYRAPRQWKGANGDYLTSEGKTRKDGHATRARWCDCYGKAGDQWEGVTFFSNPGNFRHPEPMRLWPEPDNYIFFNFCPSQAGAWEMKPGEDHVFRYRWYVHEGKPDVEQIERIWNEYANPPQVKVEAARPAQAMVLVDKDFSQWQRDGGGPIGWKFDDGVIRVVPKTGSIMTKRDFRDFMMHAEFKTPQMPPEVQGQGRGNSGIYIQRRYEVQILDSYGLEPKNNECGSIYTFKAPDQNVCKEPGEWQTYDILFRAARWADKDGKPEKVENARITVFQNGVLIHDNIEVPRKTGAGRPEGPQPMPILLQDHGNEVSFRNLWIVPLD